MTTLDKLMAVYAKNLRQLLALARSIVCESQEAEDVLQDVIVKLLSNPAACEKVSNPAAFLRTCVRHEAIDHVRRLGRENPTPQELLAGMRGSMSEAEFKRVESMLWIRSRVDGLSPEMREAFIAYAVDGYTIAQLARQMGIGQDTLRKRFNTVKKQLRKDAGSADFP